ncbi:transcriptional regulator, AlpA family [Lachnospiraceae bacterium XBB2008]|nr:transcriptional regulator, AlpA family [Lachnospiraceae bacterium XBB2008]
METRVYTILEVAGMLGISRSYAYEMVRQGVIPSIKLGERKRVIPKETFLRWINESATTNEKKP